MHHEPCTDQPCCRHATHPRCRRAQVPPPSVVPDAPLQLLVTNVDYDEHKGRVAIGRVTSGTIRKAQPVRLNGSSRFEWQLVV